MRSSASTGLHILLILSLASALGGCPSGSNKPDDVDVEVCDGVDEDEDGVTDEGCDLDGDGFCGAVQVLTGPDGSWPASCPQGVGDCADDDADVHPGAPEACNGVDEDCDQETDEGCDQDGDGYCHASLEVSDPPPAACPQGGGDCADDDVHVHPGAEEICNDRDDNCDAQADETCDLDGDGFCGGVQVTTGPDGSWPDSCPQGVGDCDDDDPAVYPNAPEACNDLDDDCDDSTDEDCDPDGDGWCDASLDVSDPLPAICPQGGGDCREDDAAIHPGATEICDDLDQDCDDLTDEGCNEDGDGFCAAGLAVIDPPPATCPLGPGDCDDTRPEAYPGAPEICNDLVEDCGGVADAPCDEDGDGYCDAALEVSDPLPTVCPQGGGDCDDQNPAIHPQAPESCGLDANCDGEALGADLGQIALVRQAEPAALGADMAFDGTDLALVWIDEGTLSLGARFALLDAAGQILVGPLDLTADGLPAFGVSVALEPNGNRWAVAYTQSDLDRNQVSLFLTYVDAQGGISPPIYLDAGGLWPKLLATDQHLAVFYSRLQPDYSYELLYLSYDPALGQASTPVSITSDSNALPQRFSFQWRANDAAHDGTIYAVRSVESFSPQFLLFSVYGDGSLRHPLAWRDLPSGELSGNVGLAVIQGSLRLLWVSEAQTSLFDLEMADLDEAQGEVAGAPTLLVTGVLNYWTHVPSAIQQGPDAFGLIYATVLDQQWYLTQIDLPTLLPAGPPVPLGFSDLRPSTSTQTPLFYDGLYTHLLHMEWPPAYFDLTRVDAASTVTSVQPVTAPPYSSAFSPWPAYADYDPDQDVFTLVQNNPVDPATYELARVAGDGTVLQVPTWLDDAPPHAARVIRHSDGSILCFTVPPESGGQIAAGIHRLDGNGLQIGAANLPVGPDVNAYMMPVGLMDDGRSDWLVVTETPNLSGGIDFAVRYLVFGTNGLPEIDLLTIQVDNPYAATYIGYIPTDQYVAVALGYLDHATTGHLTLSVVDRQTSTLTVDQAPAMAPAPGLAPINAYLSHKAGSFDGGQFFLPVVLMSFATGDFGGTRLLLFAPDQAVPDEVSNPDDGLGFSAFSTAPGRHTLCSVDRLVGTSTMRTFDADGAVLYEQVVPLHAGSEYGPDYLMPLAGGLSADLQSERWLFIVGSKRLAILGGDCTEPL